MRCRGAECPTRTDFDHFAPLSKQVEMLRQPLAVKNKNGPEGTLVAVRLAQ
jgi:hypothetical protein